MKKPDVASNVEWLKHGADDPFWGVASWEGREKDGKNPWDAEEFYELGLQDWRDCSRHWRDYGMGGGVAAEIGSGAGRLTMHMAHDFTQVIGVDVSEGMIATARQHIDAPTVDFRLGDGAVLPIDTGTVDGVFSTHVFQHFESLELAAVNFREVARILTPGGTAMIHLPVYIPPRTISLCDSAVITHERLARLRAKVNRRRGKFVMRSQQYSWHWLRRELPKMGLGDVELAIFATSSNNEPHPFILARKASL